MMEQVWMDYKDYIFEKIWLNLRFRGVSTKVIQEIYDQVDDSLSNLNEVLTKYNIDLYAWTT
jgi:hypothetical protein